jgi:hypothetical protein
LLLCKTCAFSYIFLLTISAQEIRALIKIQLSFFLEKLVLSNLLGKYTAEAHAQIARIICTTRRQRKELLQHTPTLKRKARINKEKMTRRASAELPAEALAHYANAKSSYSRAALRCIVRLRRSHNESIAAD